MGQAAANDTNVRLRAAGVVHYNRKELASRSGWVCNCPFCRIRVHSTQTSCRDRAASDCSEYTEHKVFEAMSRAIADGSCITSEHIEHYLYSFCRIAGLPGDKASSRNTGKAAPALCWRRLPRSLCNTTHTLLLLIMPQLPKTFLAPTYDLSQL